MIYKIIEKWNSFKQTNGTHFPRRRKLDVANGNTRRQSCKTIGASPFHLPTLIIDWWNTNRSWLQLKNYIFLFNFHLKVQKSFHSSIELRRIDSTDMFSSPSSATVTENIVANDIKYSIKTKEKVYLHILNSIYVVNLSIMELYLYEDQSSKQPF